MAFGKSLDEATSLVGSLMLLKQAIQSHSIKGGYFRTKPATSSCFRPELMPTQHSLGLYDPVKQIQRLSDSTVRRFESDLSDVSAFELIEVCLGETLLA